MKKINLKHSNLVANMTVSLKKVMEMIIDNQRGSIIVVDDKLYLQGVVSDGDIRRSMLRGATLMTPVLKILNMNPIVIDKEELSERKVNEIFEREKAINILPIVDKDNKLVDVIIRDPKKRKELYL